MSGLSAPIDLSIEITGRCNLSCIHCFQPDGRRYVSLSTDEILKLGDEFANMGVFTVYLSGGEPLLNPDWATIADYYVSLGLTVGLSTNGTLITREVATTIRKLNLYTALQVSLDGSKAEIHDQIRGDGAFKRTLQGLDRLAEVGVYPNIAITVMTTNISDVPNVIEFAVERRLNHVHVMSLMPAGRAQKAFSSLDPTVEEWTNMEAFLRSRSQELRGRITVDWGNRRYLPRDPSLNDEEYDEVDRAFAGCSAGKSKAVIDFGGNVYGCDLLKYENLRAGNVRESDFKDIWDNSVVLQRWRERKSQTIRGKCQSCRWLFACVGGCPALAMAEGLTIYDSDPSCPGPVEDSQSSVRTASPADS